MGAWVGREFIGTAAIFVARRLIRLAGLSGCDSPDRTLWGSWSKDTGLYKDQSSLPRIVDSPDQSSIDW